jgi:hypothetical protein
MTSPNILSFIKTVYAGTGTASDINYLIVIIILFLLLLLAINFLISALHRYIMNRLQNSNTDENDVIQDYDTDNYL